MSIEEETLDEENERAVVTPALIRMSTVAGLGGLLFGFDTGVVSGALLVIGTDLGGERLTTFQEEAIVSSALVGALLGSFAAGRLADWWGRKPLIIVAAVLFALGAVEQAAAQVFKEVILGRVFVGVGVGLASTVIPTYLAELSPAKYRGRIVGSLVVLITGGQVLAYIVDAIFFSFHGSWRYMFGFGAVPAIVQLILSFSLPESPHYLIKHQRTAPARKTLKSLYPLSTEAAIQRRIDKIEIDVQDDQNLGIVSLLASRNNLRQAKESILARLWNDRANRKALILACGLQFFQQMTGFNTLMYYSGKILQSAHFAKPVSFAIFIAVANCVCTVVALRLIDHVGRRILLLRTLLGMTCGMFFLGVAFLFIPVPMEEDPPETVHVAGAWAYVSLLSMIVFCSSYALGLGNVPWVIQSEVFNHEMRALGTGFATATNWTSNLIVAATFLHLSEAITPSGAFWLYGVITILAWLFTYFYLPETKGLDLDATRALFERGRWYDEEPQQGLSSQGAVYQSIASREEEVEEGLEQDNLLAVSKVTDDRFGV